MEELETLYGHIELEYKHLDEIRKNMTYLTRRMSGMNSFNRFSTSSADARALIETYTNLYSVIVHHIENLYDRTGEFTRLRRIQRHPSATSRTSNHENYAYVNGQYYFIDNSEAERIINPNNEVSGYSDEGSNQSASSGNNTVHNNNNNNSEPSSELQTHEESQDVPQTSSGFRHITPLSNSPDPQPRVRAPFQSQVLDVRRSLLSPTQNAAGGGNTNPPGFNFNPEQASPRTTFRTPPSIWNAAASRQSYNSRPQPSMSALFHSRQNQRDGSQRDTETLIDNVDESFDALVNQVNSYSQTQRRLFNSHFGDGGLAGPFFNNITNELLRSFSEPVVVAPNERQLREATSNIVFSDIVEPINTQCPISLETFRPNSTVTQILHCRHIFSPSSFTTWFSQNVRCPVCRYDIRTNISPESPNPRNISRGTRDYITPPAYDESHTVSESDSPSSSDSPYPSLEEADRPNNNEEEINVMQTYSMLPDVPNELETSNNELNQEISDRIDREIRNEIDRDLETGLMDVEDDDENIEEDPLTTYGPPPPPQPSRPPPDPIRFPPRSPIEDSGNPVFEAVRNLLNSPTGRNIQFGPTGLTGGFNIRGNSGFTAMGSAILSNIMASQIENVHFDPSNNQVRFETTIWDSSWNTQNN
tara:strand:- start:32707 stop:34644 length:1938 start_codon:yes stop_codon:yes gene_type:complete